MKQGASRLAATQESKQANSDSVLKICHIQPALAAGSLGYGIAVRALDGPNVTCWKLNGCNTSSYSRSSSALWEPRNLEGSLIARGVKVAGELVAAQVALFSLVLPFCRHATFFSKNHFKLNITLEFSRGTPRN